MFSDPTTIEVRGVDQIMPRITFSGQSSLYRTADEQVSLRISHQTTSKKRVRRMVRIDAIVAGSDPFDVTVGKRGAFGVYIVIDTPSHTEVDNVDAVASALVQDLSSWLTANTSANLVKILSSEI